ncbi:MAG TPA: phage major capsid protein [Sulfitobacter sp.]|uniref:phage major capsid protein n=1 Tax=Sulfitobacter sp. TaxID=1903071 RepID=UPI000EE6A499|nr:phage major capsid protein [Sulfitobacter sp.]HCQ59507.1 phage major capsid protein [Sulfitobacter sp.]|tara:strand:- start:183 stop:1421 length:1239 start_codon:yes stop_codon:yes gene_type:complete
MLTSKKLELRRSEIRQNLAELANIETPSEDETRKMGELDMEYRAKETQYRAALISEDEQRDAAKDELETRSGSEWAEMMGKFELRQVAFALDEGAVISGATKEIIDEMRSAGGYQGIPIPLAALETRAGETVASGTISPENIRPVIDRIFPGSVAEKLGIQRINIPQGSLAFPVATGGASFGWQTSETGNVGAAAAYATTERSLSPDQTGGAQMVITRKALKQSGEGLEAAIRRDLNAVIGAELDNITVNGLGSSGEPLGIIPGAVTYGIESEDVSAAASWSAFRAEIVAFMEANAITSASQVNLAFDPTIWADLDDALISGTAVSEWDRLTKHVGTPAISNIIPSETAVMTANVQGVAPGYLGIYGGIDLIRDPFTKAASGSLVLTGLVTADFTVPRGLQTRILTNLAAGS